MAISFSGNLAKYYTLAASSQHNWCGATQASQWFFLRIDSAIPNGIPGGDQASFLGKVIFDYWHVFQPSAGPQVTVRFHVTGPGGNGQADVPLSIGVVCGIALTWDGVAGHQILWVSGQPYTLSNVTGPTTTSFAAMTLGLMVPNMNCAFTVDKPYLLDGYVFSSGDRTALLNGADPPTIGTPAIWRGYYSLAGTVGATPVHTDLGMTNAVDGTLNFVSESGAGIARYSAPLVWSPTVTAHPYVTGCGKAIAMTFTSNIDGSVVTPSQVFTVPSLTVNGVDKGPLTQEGFTIGTNQCLFYSTPGAIMINPGDTAVLSAPSAWCNTPQGPVGALSGTIANRSGGSSVGADTLTKTMRMGINLSMTSALEYYPFLNAMYLAQQPGNFGKLRPGSWQFSSTGRETGLFLLVWDATIPTNPDVFGISTGRTDLVHVTAHPEYDVSPPNGVGYVRVIEVQPVAGSAWDLTYGGFNLRLDYSSPTGGGNYANAWLCFPGEWSFVDGVPTLDRSDPFALSDIFVDRIQGVSEIRAAEHQPGSAVCNSFPTPELLVPPTDVGAFWQNSRIGPKIGFTSLGPLDVAATPWIYSAQFKQAGNSFTAHLANPINTAPAVGTHEAWVFTDGATAPLLAQLEIDVDTERVRLIGQGSDANHWIVYRGSSGTTPATHAAGPVTVWGRLPIRSVLTSVDGAGNGLIAGTVACTMMTSVPHGITSEQLYGWQGAINITLASGQVANGFQLGLQYTTGPNTFLSYSGGYPTPAAGNKPNGVYTLNPANVFIQTSYYVGMPVEVLCNLVAKFDGTRLHVNIPIDACDDLVYTMARIVRDNFPAGRGIFVELGDEPWNFAFPFQAFVYLTTLGALATPAALRTYQLAPYAYQAARFHQIFRQVFAAAGRGSEIMGGLNCQMGSGASQITPHLNLGLAVGAPFDAMFIAPYYQMTTDPTTVAAFAAYDDDQMCELLQHDITYGPEIVPAMMDAQSAIHAYNAANGKKCILAGYEGGCGFASPSPAPYSGERNHDIQYNPSMYWTEWAFFKICQDNGFDHLDYYGLGIGWPFAWGINHARRQPHSRGDGLNGASDNRHLLCDPRSPYYIAPGHDLLAASTRQDIEVDSVRGQALFDWQAAVGMGPPPGATAYTATAPNPASGLINTPSGNFTVQPNGLYTGTVTITPSGGGLSTPIVLTWNNSSIAATFTITPTVSGTVTLTLTNSGGLTGPDILTYTATAPPPGMIHTPWLGSWFGHWFAELPPRIGRPVNLRARTRKATR